MSTSSPVVSDFGTLSDGRSVQMCCVVAGECSMTVLNLGGVVQSLTVPDATGRATDVVVGFDAAASYFGNYVSALVGRYANRIAGGQFTLDGTVYPLPVNDRPGGTSVTLHGGPGGWDSRLWEMTPFERADAAGVVLTLESPDGDNGFPGTVRVKVTYTLTAGGVWRVEYEGRSEKPTPLNMTQHAYFNLNGSGVGDVADHKLQLRASRYLPVGKDLIPNRGEVLVTGTPFDFTAAHRVGDRIEAAGGGYDHCFVIDRVTTDTPELAATLSSDKSGIALEVWTTEPGVQVYTAEHFSSKFLAKGDVPLYPRCGLALETQHYPDSPNQPLFPCTIVRPGQVYRSCTEYRFAVNEH